MKTYAIIQARTGSSRLPGKILRRLGDETVIRWVHDRVSQTKGLDGVVVAMPTGAADDELAEHVGSFCNLISRGSESDVLSRYADAARAFPAERYVRATSDCPFFDPDVLSEMLVSFDEKSPDYMTNTLEPHLPRGLDAEVFTAQALFRAEAEAKAEHEREHVTPHIYQNPDAFDIAGYRYFNEDYSRHRWTLDTAEDWELIRKMYDRLDKSLLDARTADFLQMHAEDPSLRLINAAIAQKKLDE